MAGRDADILVAGAGPTGLALAAELCRRGRRPRVVDAALEPSRTSKALAVHARSLERLEPLGVASRLLEAGLPIRALELHAGERRLVRLSFDGIPSYYGFVLSIPQAETERILAERLRELGGAVERGRAVAAVALADDAVQVRWEPGQDGGAAAAPEPTPASWLAGCDGAHSAVRESLGLAFHGESRPERFALADLVIDWNRPHDVFRAFLAPEGPMAVIPLPAPGAVRAVALFPPEDEDERATADGARWERRFRARTGGERVKVRQVLWSSLFRIHRRRVERLGRGRVLLAGDAAHVHSPVGGQGMNLGLHDALEAARLLAEAPEISPEALLRDYERLRVPAIDTVLRETALATRAVTARRLPARALRDALAWLGPRLPPVRRRVLRAIGMKEPVHAPHGDPNAVA